MNKILEELLLGQLSPFDFKTLLSLSGDPNSRVILIEMFLKGEVPFIGTNPETFDNEIEFALLALAMVRHALRAESGLAPMLEEEDLLWQAFHNLMNIRIELDRQIDQEK